MHSITRMKSLLRISINGTLTVHDIERTNSYEINKYSSNKYDINNKKRNFQHAHFKKKLFILKLI